MGFFSILFYIIVGWLLWQLIKIVTAGYRFTRQYRRAVNDMRQAFGGYGPATSQQRQQPSQPPKKEKKISRDVGEYVDFEEVSVSVKEKYADGSTAEYTKTEQQIVDVTWEDLPKKN